MTKKTSFNFFKDYGLELKEGDIKGRMDQNKYEEMVKQKRDRGFLDLLLELFSDFLKLVSEAIEEERNKNASK